MSIQSTDDYIIKLYYSRDEQALTKTEEEYGSYCRTISHRVLDDYQDVEECVNDMLLQAWNSIPPTYPQSLKAYLGKMIRNISLNRYKDLL